ncbi:phosphoribosylformylglycinamidine synthase I [Ammoniphilus oxalaticus]|uniref:Phosphoribosylformylglycinamidine synthase subunit PurQ n=1 Tax=Ammoniphilus oxalaticus TaxID=66863 RepID=A0A419SDE1_9BACL|nr:phosphoribosylformylglycinamidine synthase subunit PurQ [Ammoniphilus oxalaticus]RKD21091.1 phosphoribosylformylglycinamidine synthase I [Ammoniphilus oxalaticus]
MNVAVIVFPGSNGSLEMDKAVQDCLEHKVDYVRHTETDLSNYDVILLPGGATFGDYLRPGAMASVTPIMAEVKQAAAEGKLVLGVSNGFQVLTEAGLLPGAFLQNEKPKFRTESITVKVDNNETPFTLDFVKEESIQLPIAHGFGNYYCEEETLRRLEQNQQIVFRYEGQNPNGSVAAIAGIVNEAGNVLGMMPHPERATQDWLGSVDGRRVFTSILKYWRDKNGAA